MSNLELDAEQLDRYSRHVIMDEVGPGGQAALLDSSVLVVGAGGLGTPVIQYLAAAGVGRLGIADADVVERSNLQRQVIHGDADIDRPKVDSAAEFVAKLNPDITVERHEMRVTPETVTDLISDYDVVVDASDNFPTRFLLNDACVLADKPLSHGAVYRFEGQATTFTGGRPCYRCLFPEAPPEGSIPDCATAGVLGVLPGTVGAIQATEVIKLLIGEGDTLDGRLLIYDASNMTMETVPLKARPDCPVCGTRSLDSVSEASYSESCAVPE
ncbi:MAG: molybdopterin-synthase adenylyltransferase MoeB [Halovenus sp.]